MSALAPENLPLAVNGILFALAAAGIWIAGGRLSACADEICTRKRMGHAIMGLVFLAAATELPELATTLTAAIEQNASLVLNNMFGGITMQTVILAAADVTAVGAALTSFPRKPTPALQATLLILLLSLLLGIAMLGDLSVIAHVGLGSVLLTGAYLLVVYVLRNYDENSDWTPVALPEEEPEAEEHAAGLLQVLSMAQLVFGFFAASLVILICGIALVELADAIAAQTGLGTSFIGVTILAASTSLPELSTTIAAVRLGAYTMAISNIFGSNLIMLALLLPADFFYRGGPILSATDPSARFALVSGIAVSAVYLVGLLIRRKPRVLGMGADSVGVVGLYAMTLVALYLLR